MSTVETYRVGDYVDVWSQAHRRWFYGRIVQVPEGSNVRYEVHPDEWSVVDTLHVLVFELKRPSPSPNEAASEANRDSSPFEPDVMTRTIGGVLEASERTTPPSKSLDAVARTVRQKISEKKLGYRHDACETLIGTLVSEYDPETPERMARAFADLSSGYGEDVGKLLKTFPIDGDHGMVAIRDMPFASLCEHHVLPFWGRASVVYVPEDRIVGLSKIPRLLRAVSRRLQVQERIGVEVAQAIMAHVRARGVMVVIRGQHSCMALRGAESPGEMVTSCVRGCFAKDAAARAEGLDLIR